MVRAQGFAAHREMSGHEIGVHLRSRLVAILRTLRGGSTDNLGERVGNGGVYLARVERLAVNVREHYLHGALDLVIRGHTGEQAVIGGAQRIDVGAGVQGLGLALLGTHVIRRPDHLSGQGQLLGTGHCAFGEAEIGQLDRALRVEQQIARLDIPVNHSRGMRGGQPLAGIRQNSRGFQRRKGAALLQGLGEVTPFHQLHDNVVGLPLLPNLIQSDDVRMRESPGRFRFGQKAVAGRFVGSEFLRQDFDRHVTFDQRVERAVHHPHCPHAEQLHDLIARDAAADPRLGRLVGCAPACASRRRSGIGGQPRLGVPRSIVADVKVRPRWRVGGLWGLVAGHAISFGVRLLMSRCVLEPPFSRVGACVF